jgi:pyridoxal phosphate enzyme (YggS family)
MESAAERLRTIEQRIASAAARSGQDASAIRLIVVTKTATEAQTLALIAAGARHLGENRVQDAQARIRAARDAGYQPIWHMIGHLQRNKARAAVEGFDRIDSLDSLPLAQRLDRLAGDLGRRLPVLIQVNVDEDPRKQGLSLDALPPFAAEIAALPNLELDGLMTIAGLGSSSDRLRAAFERLRQARASLARSFPDCPLRQLSMGMSQDFELAVEEGATELRVGRAIIDGL